MKKQPGSLQWWLVRAVSSVALWTAATLLVAYGGAVADSSLDFGGYGDGDLYMLRQTNTWWDEVSYIGEGSAPEAVERVRAVRLWDTNLIASVVRAGAASGSWPRDVLLIGWPSRCLWGVRGVAPEAVDEGLEPVPAWLEEIRFVHNPLPTRVWWPGMLCNVAVFGGGAMALLSGPRVVQRWRWRRRGGCATCGYDVRGVTVCPECGSRVAAAR